MEKLAIKHHPDRLIAQGIPQDIIETNTYRLKEINNAWDLIRNKSIILMPKTLITLKTLKCLNLIKFY